MSAAARLWARAPAWRGALAGGVLATTLAILYPPLGAPPPSAHYAAPALPSVPDAQPSAVPAPVPLATGIAVDAPAFGTTMETVAAFAGGQVPLPVGVWVTVASLGGRTTEGKKVTAAVLAQTAGAHLDALLFLSAIDPPGAAGTGFPSIVDCQESRNVFSRTFSARDGGEQACWSIDAVAVPWDGGGDPMRASAVAELRQRGLALPEVMLRTRLLRANGDRLWRLQLLLAVDVPPEGPHGWDPSRIQATPDRLLRVTRLRDWAAAWWPLVDRGFAGYLAPGKVTPSLAMLPR